MHFDYSFYDTVYQEIRARGESGWGGNDRLSKAASHISKILHHRCIPKGRRALEVGCGEGNQSRLMASLGYQVTGIDVSATAIAWAREKTPVLPHIESTSVAISRSITCCLTDNLNSFWMGPAFIASVAQIATSFSGT